MSRTTTALASVFSLLIPIGGLFPVGLAPAVGIGAGLLSTQAAYAQSAEDWLNSGIQKASRGNLQGAIADYTQAIIINPMYAVVYYNRGNTKAHLKDWKGAIYDFTKAIKIDPNDAIAFLNRGFVKENIGDLKGACTDWRKAADLADTQPAKWIKEKC